MNSIINKNTFSPLSSWLRAQASPLIISGPCSAESRDQVIKTASRLHATGVVSAFRSGVWKPRTRPSGFEGHGELALQWLKEVKETFGFPIAIEVATPQHIELSLRYGMDILWLGARTSVNPFSVQEITEALKGVDIPVMVKNPLNPDLTLWIGVIERLVLAGITKIAAIHRGFNTYEKSKFRNEPLWDIPVKLKSHFPSLPVLSDPSHIAGQRHLVAEVTQKALLLNSDGFMIESHYDPSIALTDASQQLTPEQLSEMVHNLKIPVKNEENPCGEMEALRNRVDDLDNRLLDILAKRMQIVEDIAKIKKECKMGILQLNRWQTILDTRIKSGREKGLGKEFLQSMLELIHKESIEIQSGILK